uniref:Uncharacterized protein n=1 Tax=Arundo donax TaxID=35708 RepID=A0A0A9AKL6_ARUDO
MVREEQGGKAMLEAMEREAMGNTIPGGLVFLA